MHLNIVCQPYLGSTEHNWHVLYYLYSLPTRPRLGIFQTYCILEPLSKQAANVQAVMSTPEGREQMRQSYEQVRASPSDTHHETLDASCVPVTMRVDICCVPCQKSYMLTCVIERNNFAFDAVCVTILQEMTKIRQLYCSSNSVRDPAVGCH